MKHFPKVVGIALFGATVLIGLTMSSGTSATAPLASAFEYEDVSLGGALPDHAFKVDQAVAAICPDCDSRPGMVLHDSTTSAVADVSASVSLPLLPESGQPETRTAQTEEQQTQTVANGVRMPDRREMGSGALISLASLAPSIASPGGMHPSDASGAPVADNAAVVPELQPAGQKPDDYGTGGHPEMPPLAVLSPVSMPSGAPEGGTVEGCTPLSLAPCLGDHKPLSDFDPQTLLSIPDGMQKDAPAATPASATEVPEPVTGLLFGIGILGLVIASRRTASSRP